MSKKAQKIDKGEDSWRKELENVTINEKNFNVQVVFIEAAGTDQDFMYISKFESYAHEEKRSVVKIISKTETIFMVNQRGIDKKERDPNCKIFEEALEYVKDKKEIPVTTIALLLKFQILEMKTNYLAIRQEKRELEIGLARESEIMFNPKEIRGTVTKPAAMVPVIASPTKSSNTKKEIFDDKIAAKDDKKYKTNLRERGEEWRDKVYVDDWPIDGPHLYVVITNFSDPVLLGALIKVKVPLDAVIQVRIDALQVKVPPTLIRPSKRGASQQQLLADKATLFWTEIQSIRVQPNIADLYKNTAFIVFKPPYWASEVLVGEDDSVYNEISFLLFDIQDLKRQHKHYLKNMQVINMLPKPTNPNALNQYNMCLSEIPNECTTITLIVNDILYALETNVDFSETEHDNNIKSETTLTTDTVIDKKQSKLEKQVHETKIDTVETTKEEKSEKTRRLIHEIFDALQASHEQTDFSYLRKDCHFKDPVVIDNGDCLSSLTFHFRHSVDINTLHLMLVGMPLNKLWKSTVELNDLDKAKINYHLKMLSNSFRRPEIEYSELARLLHILSLRKLYDDRSTYSMNIEDINLEEFKNSYLKRSAFCEPLHKITTSMLNFSVTSNSTMNSPSYNSGIFEACDSYECVCSTLFHCPDISNLISRAELSSQKPDFHMIDDYEYFEDYDLKSSLQVVNCAFNTYNCVNYKFCKITDSILLLFYDSYNSEGIFTNSWKTNLTTPVCLQDFFDFVLEEQYKWIQEEENLHDALIRKICNLKNEDQNETASQGSCIDKDPPEEDLLIKGSIKYEEHLTSVFTPRVSSTALSMSVKKEKNVQESQSLNNFKKLDTRRSKTSRLFSIMSIDETKIKPFLGYDLGDRRIEIFGREAVFYSEDGTKVISKYYGNFPYNEECVSLNVVCGNRNNEIIFYRPLGMYTILPEYETIRVKANKCCQLSFKKNIFNEIVQYVNLNSSDMPSKKVLKNEVQDESSAIVNKTCYKMCLSCENGLIVELEYIEKSTEISYVRQYYITDKKLILNEEKRCISKSGEVIIFSELDEILVLSPDSSIIICTKYERKDISKSNLKESDGPLEVQDNNNPILGLKAKIQKSSTPDVSMAGIEVEIEEKKYEIEFQEYHAIEANGRKRFYSGDEIQENGIYLIRTATDYNVGEIFSRRMDGTNFLYNKEGTLIVNFPDKTRIVSSFHIYEEEVFPEWTDEEIELFNINIKANPPNQQIINVINIDNYESFEQMEEMFEVYDEGYVFVYLTYTIEHVNFATVFIDKSNEEITLTLPKNIKIIANNSSNYDITVDNDTNISFTSETENIRLEYIACPELNATTVCEINLSKPEENENTELTDNYLEAVWLRMKDSYGKCVTVNYDGILKREEIPKINSAVSNTMLEEEEAQDYICDACRQKHLISKYRFFVMNRDNTVSELLHSASVDDYKTQCLMKVWGSASNYDVFGGNRELLSMLRPIHMNYSQKFLMDSIFVDKPINLVYKDLREDSGKGFYKWMRPFKRFCPTNWTPAPAVDEETPLAFILRTLEREWSDNRHHDKLKGAKELVRAIARYVVTMELEEQKMTEDPIIDGRSAEEIIQYQLVQQLAQKTIEKMEKKLDVMKQQQCDKSDPVKLIKIPEIIEHHAVSPEDWQEECSSDMETLAEELEIVEPMRPQLARYWRLRAEAEAEAEYNREILRSGYVPPYFQYIYGGEIWAKINDAVTEAMDISEGIKTPANKTLDMVKCHCIDSFNTLTKRQ